MALNRTIKSLLVKQWTSMMVENSHSQGREGDLVRAICANESARWVMDFSQMWRNTPQDHMYWSDIANNL